MKITKQIKGCLDRIQDFAASEGFGAMCFVAGEGDYNVLIGGDRLMLAAALATEALDNEGLYALLRKVCELVERHGGERDKETKS